MLQMLSGRLMKNAMMQNVSMTKFQAHLCNPPEAFIEVGVCSDFDKTMLWLMVANLATIKNRNSFMYIVA